MTTLRDKLDRLGELGGFVYLGVDARTGRDLWQWEYVDAAEVARREAAGEPTHYELTASGPVVWGCACPAFALSARWDERPECKHSAKLSEDLRPAPGPAPAPETPADRRRKYREGWSPYLKAAA